METPRSPVRAARRFRERGALPEFRIAGVKKRFDIKWFGMKEICFVTPWRTGALETSKTHLASAKK
jgi:hypothetical protein